MADIELVIKIDEDEYKKIVANKYAFYDKMYNSIKNVSNTLSHLIESFPPDSYYQLIGFGSDYEKYDLQPKINNQENIIWEEQIYPCLLRHRRDG